MDEEEKKELADDATLYGEFVCSAFHWITPKEQKQNAKHLENATENKKDKPKNK